MISCQKRDAISFLIWFHSVVKNSVDLDQLASDKARQSGSTLFFKRGYRVLKKFWVGDAKAAQAGLQCGGLYG